MSIAAQKNRGLGPFNVKSLCILQASNIHLNFGLSVFNKKNLVMSQSSGVNFLFSL